MRAKSQLNFQYAHRFLGFEGEAQYLHGHTETLLIEIEGEVDPKTGFAFPCNSIKNIAWDYLKNFEGLFHILCKPPNWCRIKSH